MTSSTVRKKLKQMTPPRIRNAARHCLTYLERLNIWRQVMAQVDGVEAIDKQILRDSLRDGIFRASQQIDLWRDPQLIGDATIRVPQIGEFAIRAYSDDLYHVLPSRERAVVSEIKNRLRFGDTFVDAGANIGFFTILAAGLVGETGRVYAVEMMTETADRLRINVSKNDLATVTIFETALCEKGAETLLATVPEQKFGRASIVLKPAGEARRQVPVRTSTLDELFSSVEGTIHLIKMDLEGAETMALSGGLHTLERTNAVIFEQLPGEHRASALLQASGFTLQMLDGNNFIAVRT